MSTTENILSALGIAIIKEELTATPGSTDFLQFAYQVPVTEFSGKFTLHSQTTNVSFLYCYLFDANMQMLTAEGSSSPMFLMDTPYYVTSTVKYINIFGRSQQPSTATATLFLVTNMLMGGGSVPFLNHSHFTDGKNYSNTFVKELYIPNDIFEMLEDGHHLILYQARNTDATVPLINIVDRESFNNTTNTFNNYFSSNDYNADIIELKGAGIFTGRKCYLVADWEMTWTLCKAEGMVNNHEIIFQADIIKETATHLKLSPTIATNFKPELPSYEEPPLSSSSFIRETFAYGNGTYAVVENVDSEASLLNALNQHTNVVINLTNDIKLSNKIVINGKNVIINGNDHKIYEYHNEITSPSVTKGCRTAEYAGTVNINTAFNTPDGKTLLLTKSPIFQSEGWGNEHTRVRFSAPNIIPDTDNVFVSYGIWFVRRSNQISSWSNGYLTAEIPNSSGTLIEETIYNLGRSFFTHKPYYYLVNYGEVSDSIIIKNGKIFFPSAYPSIAQCILGHLIEIKGNSKVEFNNVRLNGGLDSVIDNDSTSTLRMNFCKISNKTGAGITSIGKLYVSNCHFKDILGTAISITYDVSRRNTPTYAPYGDIVDNIFTNIGTYGSNVSAITSNGKAYIANNKIIDANYNAISLGTIALNSNYTNIENIRIKEACNNLVEHNIILNTQDWIRKRKRLGLQDNGAIYIIANNKQAIIRYNTIIGTGGALHEAGNYSRGIFCDDGAYNMVIYGNVVAHTERSYGKNFDIDSRDIPNTSRIIAPDEISCANNFICNNVCDGWLKMQEHNSTIAGEMGETGCNFNNNILLRKHMPMLLEEKNIINSPYHPYTKGIPFCYVWNSNVDEKGTIFSELDFYGNIGIINYINE